MKKALAIISAVAIASAFAFAEDAPALKLSGYLDTGIRAVVTDSKTAADTFALTGDDSGNPTRFDINGTYTNGNAGVDFKLRTNYGTAASQVLDNYDAWALFADGKVKVVAGKLDTSSWKTEGDDGFTAENGQGIQVQVMPVAGLNVGVKFNTAAENNAAGTVAQMNGKQFFQEMGFGGKYTSDLVNIAAGYTLDSKFDDTTWGDNADKNAAAYAGVNYKGIQNVTLIGEAKWTGLGKYSDLGLGEYDEIINYKASDALTVGILMYQYVPGSSDAKVKMSFKPNASYVVNSLVKATGEIKYTINDDYTKDVTTIDLKPGVVLSVSSNSAIYVNDNYEIKDINKKGAYNYSDSGVKALTTNTFDVGFRFNF